MATPTPTKSPRKEAEPKTLNKSRRIDLEPRESVAGDPHPAPDPRGNLMSPMEVGDNANLDEQVKEGEEGTDGEKSDSVCDICECDADIPGTLLLCDNMRRNGESCCPVARHIYCCQPPLAAVPDGDWHCSRLCRGECVRSDQLYGKTTLEKHGFVVKHSKDLAAALQTTDAVQAAEHLLSSGMLGRTFTADEKRDVPRYTGNVRQNGQSPFGAAGKPIEHVCDAAEATTEWDALGLNNAPYKPELRHWRLIGTSKEGCDRQQDHRDAKPHHGDEPPPLVVIAPLQEGSTLDVSPYSHLPDRDRGHHYVAQSVRVALTPGDLLVFRADLVHAGSPYTGANWRLHCDVLVRKQDTREGDTLYDFDDLAGKGLHVEPNRFLHEMGLLGSLAPPSSAASSALAPPQSQGSGRQDPATVARILELGAAGKSVVDIDRTLHREQHRTSKGTPWPAKNDGRVVVRTLLNNNITPVTGDPRVARYVSEYASKIADMDKAPPPPPAAADKPIQWSVPDLLGQAGLTDYEAAFDKHGYDDAKYLVETVAYRDDLLNKLAADVGFTAPDLAVFKRRLNSEKAPVSTAEKAAAASAPKTTSSKREAAAELSRVPDKKQRGAKLRAIEGIAQEAPTLEDPPEKEDKKDADYDVKNEDRRGLR